MRRPGTARWLLGLALTAVIVIRVRPDDAVAATGFGGTVTYTGDLGPVSPERTLCVCVYEDPELTQVIECLEVDTSPGTYSVATPSGTTYYVLAFLDLNLNVALDPGEPYQIYRNKSTRPADPVVVGTAQTSADFTFGDDHLGPIPAASPTPTSSATPTPTATATVTATSTGPQSTVTPTALPCVGDCNGDGQVTVDEILTMVNLTLNGGTTGCPAGDANGDGVITVDEILTAVTNALNGCSNS